MSHPVHKVRQWDVIDSAERNIHHSLDINHKSICQKRELECYEKHPIVFVSSGTQWL